MIRMSQRDYEIVRQLVFSRKDGEGRYVHRWQDDRATGAAFRLGPLLLQVRRSHRLELYIAVGKVSALVTL